MSAGRGPRQWRMSEPISTLVCFALPDEAKHFTAPSQVRVLVTGMGRENAARAVKAELAAGKPKLVLTCGFAGGLNPALAPCAVVCSEDAEAGLGERLRALGAMPGRIHCAERVAITAAEKAELRRATGADAVEMESQVIRDLCRERGIPSATVRVISDTATEDLPLDFNALMTPDLRLHFGKLVWQVAKSPGKIPALLALQKRTDAAARRLGEVLGQLLV